MRNPRIPFELSNKRGLLPPPNGKPLIVHNVVNVELWPFDQPMPRSLLSAPRNLALVPDVPNYCWAEYGLRCGMPRLFRLYRELELPVSVNLNASIIDVYPDLAEELKCAGWEFIAHGMTQRPLHEEESEADLIFAVVEKIEAFTGQKPRGWMSPGFAQTHDTPDYLAAAGIEYNLDWVLDDLPAWMWTENGAMIAVPYALELNDSLLFAVERHSSCEIWRRFQDTVETFERELATQPRVFTLAVHPHIIAVPHRIGYLEKILRALTRRDDVIFLTGGEIADWYRDVAPPISD